MATKTLKIAADLALPIDAATQTFAFIARKGAGKTYTAGKLVELLLEAHVQVVVLDTVGNWYGLRLGADGKSAGFSVPVLGGLRGDIPLDPASGALIADTAVDTGQSMVLDVSQWSKADRQRFAAAFGERLWLKKKGEHHPTPLHLVIEESQLIVPQDVRGDTARMVGVYEEIIRLGRNYGIGVSMITQRPQSVNKEVLNQTECLFVGQINGAQERDALKKWVTHQGADVNLVDELPGLKVGTFYCWSPQWLGILQKVHILPKRTLDASATPKVGDRTVRRELKPLDLTELEQRMAATIEQAKANDPRELKKLLAAKDKRISELEADVKVQRTSLHQASGKPTPVLTDADRALMAKLAESIRSTVGVFASGNADSAALVQLKTEEVVIEAISRLRSTLTHEIVKRQDAFEELLTRASVKKLLAKLEQVSAPVPVLAMHAGVKPATQAALVRTAQAIITPSRHHGTRESQGTGHRAEANLPPGERAVLTAAAMWPTDGVSRDQLGVLTGYKRSTRDAYIVRMQAKGLLAVAGGAIVATDAGIDALGPDFEPLPTGDALYQWWRDRLPDGERKCLDVLMANHGKPVDRETIDELTGFKRSTRDAYLSRLTARRLIESIGRGQVQPSKELFS